MDDMLRSLSRGWAVVLTAAVPLFAGAVIWTGLNLVTDGLLAGPALVGLFTIALKAHQGGRPALADAFASFERVGPPLVVGLLLVLPFQVLSFLEALAAGTDARLPLAAPLGLVPWFALLALVLLVLADRPDAGMTEAVRAAWRLADRSDVPGARLAGVTAHVVYCGAVLGVVALGAWLSSWISWIVTLPIAAGLLVPWYSLRAYPTEREGATATAARALGGDTPAAVATPPSAPKRSRKRSGRRPPSGAAGEVPPTTAKD